MWPPGHLGAGIIVADLLGLTDDTERYLALVAGSVAPDLLDKPLGKRENIEAYHTVGHSVVVNSLIAAIVVRLTEPGSRIRMFVLGCFVHLTTDFALTFDKWDDPEFFVWPLLRPVNDVERPLAEYVADYATSPWFVVELLLVWLAFRRRD